MGRARGSGSGCPRPDSGPQVWDGGVPSQQDQGPRHREPGGIWGPRQALDGSSIEDLGRGPVVGVGEAEVRQRSARDRADAGQHQHAPAGPSYLVTPGNTWSSPPPPQAPSQVLSSPGSGVAAVRCEGPLAAYEAEGPGPRGGTLGTAWAGRQRGPASGGLKGPQGGRGAVRAGTRGRQAVRTACPAGAAWRGGGHLLPRPPCRCPSRIRPTW